MEDEQEMALVHSGRSGQWRIAVKILVRDRETASITVYDGFSPERTINDATRKINNAMGYARSFSLFQENGDAVMLPIDELNRATSIAVTKVQLPSGK